MFNEELNTLEMFQWGLGINYRRSEGGGGGGGGGEVVEGLIYGSIQTE